MSDIKFGVRSWTFRHYLPKDGMTVEEFLETAKNMGFDGVELLCRHFPRFTLECALKYKELSDSLGIKIVAYALENDFCFPNKKVREAEIENVISWIKIASFTNVPYIKLFTGDRDESVDYMDQIKWLIEALKELSDIAEAYDVSIAVENHSTVCFTWPEIKDLITEINHPNIGICPDVYNFSKLKAEPIVYEAAKELIPLSSYGHLQFYEIDKTGRELHMDMPKLLNIYHKKNYKGFLMLEWEGEGDPFNATMRQIEYLHSIIGGGK
jgi:sugar phosphate isomerase/epimerase